MLYEVITDPKEMYARITSLLRRYSKTKEGGEALV